MRTDKKKSHRWEFNSTIKLTQKQEAFAVGVFSGLNLSDAYRRAGYSCGSMKTVNEALFDTK